MTEHARGAPEFDVVHGDWTVASQRLRPPLTGSSARDWSSAPCVCRPIPGGIGTIDGFSAERNGVAFDRPSLRLRNPTTGDRSIGWTGDSGDRLWPRVVRRVVAGASLSTGADSRGGIPAIARFRWTRITATSARRDQAFTPDDGPARETTRIMPFARAAGPEAGA